MKIVFYMNCVSAHQFPLAKEVAELVGAESFCYVDAGERGQEYQSCHDTAGIQVKVKAQGGEWLEESDVMLTGMRDLELFERRAKKGLRTYYTSERWFKPLTLFDLRLFNSLISVTVPGWLKMVVPRYRRLVNRFAKWANEDLEARVLAIGPWAKQDFLKMGVRAEKIVDWGYFVEKGSGGRNQELGPGESKNLKSNNQTSLKVLWCGRMLDWKRVDILIRAVRRVIDQSNNPKSSKQKISLTLVGEGPEKSSLIKIAQRFFPNDVAIDQSTNPKSTNQTIVFLPSQPMEKVRELMRQHDLLVLPSNGYEGWGAVVSEALEEGMRVLGTYEAGASAALLMRERLFHSGDWKALAQLIDKDMCGELPLCSIGQWTAKAASRRLMSGKDAFAR